MQTMTSEYFLNFILPYVLTVLGCVLFGYLLPRRLRTIKAPVPKLHRDLFYFTQSAIGYKYLFTEEQIKVARDRADIVRSETAWKRWAILTATLVFIIWVAKSIISTLFSIITWMVAPVIVLFAQKDDLGFYWLPRWLWWFQTPDNPLDGDENWRIKTNKYTRHVGWLWRNSGYGLDWVLSPRLKTGFQMHEWGNPGVSNRPINEGLRFRYIQGSSVFDTIFHFYYVKTWSSTRCIRINLGYKLFGEIKVGKVAQLVCSPSPFMSYTTK